MGGRLTFRPDRRRNAWIACFALPSRMWPPRPALICSPHACRAEPSLIRENHAPVKALLEKRESIDIGLIDWVAPLAHVSERCPLLRPAALGVPGHLQSCCEHAAGMELRALHSSGGRAHARDFLSYQRSRS